MAMQDIVKRLESLGIIGRQITQASVSMYQEAAPENGFSVCELTLCGISEKMEADIVTVSVSVDGDEVWIQKIPVMKGDRVQCPVKLDKQKIKRYMNSESECYVNLRDKYGRELASVSSAVEFGMGDVAPICTAEVSFRKEIDLRDEPIRVPIADILLRTDMDTSVYIEVADEKEQIVWQENVTVQSSAETTKLVSVDSSDIKGKDISKYSVKVKCNGKIISCSSLELNVLNKKEEPPAPKVSLSVNINGDVELPEYVDTHVIIDGMIRFGSLILLNKDDTEHDVIISVTLDGKDIACSRQTLDSGCNEYILTSSFATIARESTYSCELITHITECDGSLVMHKISTLKVRSKYDMDLRELNLRTAQFVNPVNDVVKKLVDDSNGPLAAAMSGQYTVSGYMLKGSNVYRQAEAIFKMMNRLGMRYVSDMFTVGNKPYQCVRAPDKVFEDRSGNCLEFSIFFASIAEAMGLEPVILFPKGHAVPGIVLSTDVYRSDAQVSGKEMDACSVVEMNINGKKAFVLAVESTMCPFCDNLVKASATGYSKVNGQIDYIVRNGYYCFIKRMRQSGIDPILGL